MFALVIGMLLKILEISKKFSGGVGKGAAGILKSATMVAFGGLAGASSLAARVGVRGGISAIDKARDPKATGSLREKLYSGFTSGAGTALPSMPKMSFKESVASLKNSAKTGTWDIRNAVPKGDAFSKPMMSIIQGKADSSFGQLDAKGLKDIDKKRKEEKSFEQTELALLRDIKELEKARTELAEGKKNGMSASNIADLEKNVQGHEDKISASLSKISNKDLEKIDKDALTNKNVLNLMSNEQVAHLAEKSELSDATKDKIRALREKDIKDSITQIEEANAAVNVAEIAYAASPTPATEDALKAARAKVRDAQESARKALKKLSKKEKEKISKDTVDANLDLFATPEVLSQDDFDTMMKSDSIVPGMKAKIREARYASVTTAVGGGVTVAGIAANTALVDDMRKEMNRFGENEIPKMSKKLLQDPRVSMLLTPQMLRKMMDSGDLDRRDRDVIRKNIADAVTAGMGGVGNVNSLHAWLDSDRQGKIF
jgi:hypothetical protein